MIWQRGILPSKYNEKLPKIKGPDIIGMLFSKMKKKVNTISDFKPKGWKKYIHRRAVVAKVRFSGSGMFGGLWSEQDVCGLLRLSLTYNPKKRGVAPGLALKLFVDGQSSQDISLLPSLNPQGQNYNFFQFPFSNIVPRSNSFGQKLVEKIFRRASDKPNFLGIHHLAKIQKTGAEALNQTSPLQVFTTSNFQTAKLPKRDFRSDFIKLDHLVYKTAPFISFLAKLEQNPSHYQNAGIKKEFIQKTFKDSKIIANVFLDSKFVASDFGDDQLFFQHIRF